MASIDSLDPAQARALLLVVGRIKHDLGKYVALQQRWVGPDASLEDRRAAAHADLLSTRRGPTGSQDAVAVWEGFEADLVQEGVPDVVGDPDIVAIKIRMEEIAHVIGLLRSGNSGEAVLTAGREAALDVSETCRRLARRVRVRAEGAWPTSC